MTKRRADQRGKRRTAAQRWGDPAAPRGASPTRCITPYIIRPRPFSGSCASRRDRVAPPCATPSFRCRVPSSMSRQRQGTSTMASTHAHLRPARSSEQAAQRGGDQPGDGAGRRPDEKKVRPMVARHLPPSGMTLKICAQRNRGPEESERDWPGLAAPQGRGDQPAPAQAMRGAYQGVGADRRRSSSPAFRSISALGFTGRRARKLRDLREEDENGLRQQSCQREMSPPPAIYNISRPSMPSDDEDGRTRNAEQVSHRTAAN